MSRQEEKCLQLEALQRVDKPSHSLSVLRAGAHECQIRSAPVLVLPRLQRFSITLKRRQRAKIKIILALCQQSEEPPARGSFLLDKPKEMDDYTFFVFLEHYSFKNNSYYLRIEEEDHKSYIKRSSHEKNQLF
ncbi:hypothetical protein [Bacillus safensis]|uniref:hypothetical protein n=2 Tax=Bacillus safensis TaxID=561879 RepID=UPI000B43987D|nr:hypothetical protein [Bacillus safensis]UDB48941.1 hypothetical protein B0X07_07485 [Bacillus safensis]